MYRYRYRFKYRDWDMYRYRYIHILLYIFRGSNNVWKCLLHKYIFLESEIWDLEKDKYHIMLAVGDVYDYQLAYHNVKV